MTGYLRQPLAGPSDYLAEIGPGWVARDETDGPWHLAADFSISRTRCGKRARMGWNLSYIADPHPKCRDCYKAVLMDRINELVRRLRVMHALGDGDGSNG